MVPDLLRALTSVNLHRDALAVRVAYTGSSSFHLVRTRFNVPVLLVSLAVLMKRQVRRNDEFVDELWYETGKWHEFQEVKELNLKLRLNFNCLAYHEVLRDEILKKNGELASESTFGRRLHILPHEL